MKFLALLIILSTGFFIECTSNKDQFEKGQDIASIQDTAAQSVVDRAIQAHGADQFDNAIIEFDFRGRHYTSRRNGGIFQYQRIFPDTVDGQAVTVRDVLNNDSFKRFVDDQEIPLSEKMQGSVI